MVGPNAGRGPVAGETWEMKANVMPTKVSSCSSLKALRFWTSVKSCGLGASNEKLKDAIPPVCDGGIGGVCCVRVWASSVLYQPLHRPPRWQGPAGHAIFCCIASFPPQSRSWEAFFKASKKPSKSFREAFRKSGCFSEAF